MPEEGSTKSPLASALRPRSSRGIVSWLARGSAGRESHEIAFGENPDETTPVDHRQAPDLPLEHGLRGFGERRAWRGADDRGRHDFLHPQQVSIFCCAAVP